MSEVMKTEGRGVKVTAMHIRGDVQCRFATVEMVTRIKNEDETQSHEFTFDTTLPQQAFIIYFEMEIDGKLTVGQIKEKQAAKIDYEQAKVEGRSAGHVEQSARETNRFSISVNVGAKGDGRFKLVYQELLNRVRGAYKLCINVSSQQPIPDVQADVEITDSSPISSLCVPKFAQKLSDRSAAELLYYQQADDVTISRSTDAGVHKGIVKWRPSTDATSPLNGQLVVLYDVDRSDGSVVHCINGHFIHFVSPPTTVASGSKHIVFALDISGSMRGTKLQQVKDAMNKILDQLDPDDFINIVCFDTSLVPWKSECGGEKANAQNIALAREFIRNQNDRGGTDIFIAAQQGISWLNRGTDGVVQPLVRTLVILTDGQHNSGGITADEIPDKAMALIGTSNMKVCGLAFGRDADFGLLKKLASKTGGIARMVYEDSDASLQLENFYAEIAEPIVSNLKISYLDPKLDLDSIVRNSASDTLYDGAELIITGKMKDLNIGSGDVSFPVDLVGNCVTGEYKCCRVRCIPFPLPLPRPTPESPSPLPDVAQSVKGRISTTGGDFVERTWAYLTVRKLNDDAATESSEEKANEFKKKALQLALKYGFVTDQTSLVAVQGAEEKPVSLVNPAEPQQPVHLPGGLMNFRGGGHMYARPMMLAAPSRMDAWSSYSSSFASVGRSGPPASAEKFQVKCSATLKRRNHCFLPSSSRSRSRSGGSDEADEDMVDGPAVAAWKPIDASSLAKLKFCLYEYLRNETSVSIAQKTASGIKAMGLVQKLKSPTATVAVLNKVDKHRQLTDYDTLILLLTLLALTEDVSTVDAGEVADSVAMRDGGAVAQHELSSEHPVLCFYPTEGCRIEMRAPGSDQSAGVVLGETSSLLDAIAMIAIACRDRPLQIAGLGGVFFEAFIRDTNAVDESKSSRFAAAVIDCLQLKK